MKFKAIKNPIVKNDILDGDGYILAPRISLKSECAIFNIQNTQHSDFSLVFAFNGIGHHYRLDVIQSKSIILLYFIRDGIPIYLQHASILILPSQQISLYWETESIRINLAEHNIINVLGEGLSSGHWGFATRNTSYRIPEVSTTISSLTKFQWICLGDGYSNNRWKNRHIFSWPELAFGNCGNHFNACVAAGNTRRIIDVLQSIQHRVADATVLIATGADDMIEGELMEDFLSRLNTLILNTKIAGAQSIHLCSIPPNTRYDEETIRRNNSMQQLAKEHDISFIDFYQVLAPAMPNVLVNGGYPGPQAQRMIAKLVLDHLKINSPISPLVHIERSTNITPIVARIFTRIQRAIDQMLGKLP